MVDNSTHVELAPINNITLIKKVLIFVCFVLTGEDPLQSTGGSVESQPLIWLT